MSIEHVTEAVTHAANGQFKCLRSTMTYLDGGKAEQFRCWLSGGRVIEIEVVAGTSNTEVAKRVVAAASVA